MRPRSSRGVLTSRTVLLGVGLAVLVSAALAARDDRFEEVATVTVVEVPVQVFGPAGPVRGLTAEDFEVRRDGAAEPIVAFDVVDLASGPASERPQLAASRHFLLLFDLSFSTPGSIGKAQAAARTLALEALHPTDLVAVATYTESTGVELVLSFTRDHRQLEAAIRDLRSPEPGRHFQDPLGLVVDSILDAGLPSGPAGAPGPRGAGSMKSERAAMMLQNARDLQPFARREQREKQEQQVLALSSSLEELAKLMQSVSGRKHIVLLSEGFDSSIVVGTEDLARITEMANDASVGEHWRIDSEERYGSSVAQRSLRQTLEEFRRGDCTIQAVDIGGARAGAEIKPRASGQDGLFILADETGGELFRNYNNLGEAMGELLERTSVTYVLTLQPEDLELDGSFHRLKVRLRDRRRGVRLVHRPGFYAPRPFGEQSGAERKINAAGLVIGGAEGGRLETAVLAAPFPGPKERAYVPMLVEIDGRALLADDDSGILPLEIYAYAIRDDGTIADFATQRLTLDVAKVGPVLRASGFKFWGHLELAPGDYAIRTLVRNAQTGSTALRVVPLSVPASDSTAPYLLPPLVPEPAGKWLIGQETGERPEVPYPFVTGGAAFVPAAGPSVVAGRLSLALAGYNLSGILGTVRAELLDGSGQVASELPLLTVRREPETSAASTGLRIERYLVELEAQDLAAGTYALRLAATTPDGNRIQSSPVRVVGRPPGS